MKAGDWIAVFYLALAIQGEGAGLMGPHRNQAALAIGDVVMNRYDRMQQIADPRKRWWGSTVYEIVTAPNGFHGYANVKYPEPWAVEAAIDRYYRRASSIPRGVYFVLNHRDLRNLGVGIDDERIVVRIEHDGRGLYFFRQWPGGNDGA